jgi:hypothetical protein
MNPEQTNHALAYPANENESEAAHRAAQWYAEKLLAKYGRAQVIAWLRNGLPMQAMTAVGH